MIAANLIPESRNPTDSLLRNLQIQQLGPSPRVSSNKGSQQRQSKSRSLTSINLPPELVPDAHRHRPSTLRYHQIRSTFQDNNRVDPSSRHIHSTPSSEPSNRSYTIDPSSGLLIARSQKREFLQQFESPNYKLNHPSLQSTEVPQKGVIDPWILMQ